MRLMTVCRHLPLASIVPVLLMLGLLSMSACSNDLVDCAPGKTENKSADKAGATAELPGMGGRRFSSNLALGVFIVREAGGAREWIGGTPSADPLEIPRCESWGVKPVHRVDMKTLAGEIMVKEVPCLLIENWAVDGDLAHLKGLTGLRDLNLTRTKITNAGLADLKRALPKAHIYPRSLSQ